MSLDEQSRATTMGPESVPLIGRYMTSAESIAALIVLIVGIR